MNGGQEWFNLRDLIISVGWHSIGVGKRLRYLVCLVVPLDISFCVRFLFQLRYRHSSDGRLSGWNVGCNGGSQDSIVNLHNFTFHCLMKSRGLKEVKKWRSGEVRKEGEGGLIQWYTLIHRITLCYITPTTRRCMLAKLISWEIHSSVINVVVLGFNYDIVWVFRWVFSLVSSLFFKVLFCHHTRGARVGVGVWNTFIKFAHLWQLSTPINSRTHL